MQFIIDLIQQSLVHRVVDVDRRCSTKKLVQCVCNVMACIMVRAHQSNAIILKQSRTLRIEKHLKAGRPSLMRADVNYQSWRSAYRTVDIGSDAKCSKHEIFDRQLRAQQTRVHRYHDKPTTLHKMRCEAKLDPKWLRMVMMVTMMVWQG